ncbi:MAG: TolC family protein [Crocinitomicaceae bacterium]
MNTMYKNMSMWVIGILSFSTIAQETKSFSLEEAKSFALENHITILNSQHDIEIARQQIVETRGIGLPQVGITGSFNQFINLPVQVLGANFIDPNAAEGETISFKAGTNFTSDASLQVNQMLFDGSYIIGLKAANFFLNFQKTVANLSNEDIAFNVIQAYEMAAVAKTNKAFIDSLVFTTEKLIEKQQNYLELGMILQEDMDQLNYSLLSVKSSQTVATINYENSMNMLKLSMGYPINGSVEITNTPEQLITKSSLSDGNDIYQNIQYQISEQQVRLSQFNVKLYQYKNLPSLNAFFKQTYSAFRNEFNFFANEKWYPQTLWGLSLNIPVFSGLSRYARTSQAKVTLMKNENNLKQLEQNLQFQELQFRNNVRGAKNKLELQEKNIALAKSIYENEIIKEQIGKGNSITITQKHNQLMMAQSQYIGSMVELFQSQLSLDKLYNKILPNN